MAFYMVIRSITSQSAAALVVGCIDLLEPKLARRIEYPTTPETNEPKIIPNLSSNNKLTPVSSKASEPINKLIVKPIPHNAEVPYKPVQLTPVGSCAILSFMNNQQSPKIPTCLPKNKPSAIPTGTSCKIPSNPTPLKLIPAFANAKTGRTKK